MGLNLKSLIGKLNDASRSALEAAAGLCLSRTHYDIEIEHYLSKLVDSPDGDFARIAKFFEIDKSRLTGELSRSLDKLKSGNARTPALSPTILKMLTEAWTIGSIDFNAGQIRTGFTILALASNEELARIMREVSKEFQKIQADALRKDFLNIVAESHEEALPAATAAPGSAPSGKVASGKTPNLDQYTVNLTDSAKRGKIDPVLGRDFEIRQVIDILTRRRQNNPILTGEAGVGKTAVVEGFALRVAQGDVPPSLKNVMVRTLDLALLQAGAGVKGEFENRLKGLIEEVKASPTPIILFIDEAHTMIGAGGQAGQNDAANLLKPALARGELRTIAATTFAEYKKYFETDAALKRRFQQVKVDEPDEQKAIRMLRGLVTVLEKHHKVRILDEAVVDAVRLSTRYMPDRQLPDKAVSLLDTVCARVALSQSATPPTLDDTRKELDHLNVEIEFLEREGRVSAGNPERVVDLKERKEKAEARRVALEEQLKKEKEIVAKIQAKRDAIEKTATSASEDDKVELSKLSMELTAVQGENPLVYPVTHGGAVAQVVSGLTGIPLGKMVRDEVGTVLRLADILSERVVGQKHALEAISQRIRTARADLADPRRPQGVFLLVGPSGVGKTETALALADLLYGGDRNMVIVNMSEYKESHKVSRLVGTAKGYVGYGEGGVLTNAVKNRPYSVVLLDEVEKAHESVQEIFYQVFDKGILQNDDGEDVNFKNTIILLTSNVGTDTIMKACADPDTAPSPEGLNEMLKKDLLKAFKPALLGRMTVVPYYPLGDTVLKKIIQLKLNQIGDRLKQNYKAKFTYSPAVVETISARCKDVDTGARNADHIITGTVLTEISALVLTQIAEGHTVKGVTVGVDDKSKMTYAVE
jgi:type VI secretion system protein VasG